MRSLGTTFRWGRKEHVEDAAQHSVIHTGVVDHGQGCRQADALKAGMSCGRRCSGDDDGLHTDGVEGHAKVGAAVQVGHGVVRWGHNAGTQGCSHACCWAMDMVAGQLEMVSQNSAEDGHRVEH